MLDKTIPYYNIIMKRYKGTIIPDFIEMNLSKRLLK